MTNQNSKTILIGKLLSAHGVKGNIHLISFAENPSDIINYKEIFDKKKQRNFKFSITGLSSKGKNNDAFIVKIDGVNDRNQADSLVNTELFINRDELANTKDNEFYYVDLIGLDAISTNKNKLGKVVNIYDFGAGTMIEVKFDKFIKKYDELQTFLFVDEIIPEVNIKDGYLVINIPENIEIKDSEE